MIFKGGTENQMNQHMNNKKEKDKCVVCDKDTPYNKEVNIDMRACYVEGAGQLCQNCWIDVYHTKFTKDWYSL